MSERPREDESGRVLGRLSRREEPQRTTPERTNKLAQLVQPPRFEPADGQPAEIRFMAPSRSMPAGGAGVRVWLEVTNPNPFGFTLSTVNATLSLDGTHAATGAGVLKAQHPEFELWSQGTHAQAGVSCADCHMPYERVGALKVSNHHVRSPLLNIAASCQVCHNVPEQELLRRAHTIQDRTYALINRSAEALTAMIDAIVAARATRPDAKKLEEALQLQRKAQWRIDYVYSEGSMGFHAAQESARILAEALDYARRGEGVALRLLDPETPLPAVAPKQLPLEGVTPENAAPPGPRTEEQRRAPGKSSERSP